MTLLLALGTTAGPIVGYFLGVEKGRASQARTEAPSVIHNHHVNRAA